MPQSSKRRADPTKQLQRKVLQALHTLHDPSVDCNLVDLGCIYTLEVNDNGQVYIQFTLTERGHADGLLMPGRIRNLVNEIKGVSNTRAELVWEPAWSIDRMSDFARQLLGVVG